MQKERMRLWEIKRGKGTAVKLTVLIGYKVKIYQIQYADNRALKKARTKTIKTKREDYKRVLTIKKLKPGKTYYFRVRGVKKYKGKTYRSKWSGVKKIKLKK